MSPIHQLDGAVDVINRVEAQNVTEKVLFTFKSEYGEWDIMHSLYEVFPSPELVSRVRPSSPILSADHECTVEVTIAAGTKDKFSWPKMSGCNANIFKDLQRSLQ